MAEGSFALLSLELARLGRQGWVEAVRALDTKNGALGEYSIAWIASECVGSYIGRRAH